MHNIGINLSARALVDLEPERWKLLMRLQQLAGYSVYQLRTHTLNAALAAMTGHAGGSAGRWLLSSGGQGCRFALCEACLAADPTPYWRSAWRLTVSTVCPVHRRLLVDTCPGCAGSFVLGGTRMSPLRHCERCGRTLQAKTDADPVSRVSIWRTVPTHEVRRSCLPVSLAHSKLWWDGVRVLLNVLGRGRIAAKLQHTGLPRRLTPVLHRLATGPRVAFDRQPVEMRHQMLDLVDWLTKDWPVRFVRCMNDAGITHNEFSISEIQLPYWLWSVSKEHLERKRYWPSEAEVSAVVALLKSTHRPVTKLAVKRLLGVTEGKALDALYPPMLRRLSHAEMLMVAELLSADLDSAATAREERSSLLRDACCIAAAAWLEIPLKSVARLSATDGEALLQEWREATHMGGQRGRLAQTYLNWIDLYLRSTRTRFERYELPQRALFLSRYGVPALGFGLAARFADLLRRAGVKEWQLGSRLLTASSTFDLPKEVGR